MKYQKVINLLNNTKNEPAKIRTRNQVQVNDKSRGTYENSNQIKFKT